MLKVLAHSVVLGGEEGRVEDDAEGDGGVEDHVMDHEEERVLETQPEVVVQAELATARTVAVVVRRFWRREQNESYYAYYQRLGIVISCIPSNKRFLQSDNLLLLV